MRLTTWGHACVSLDHPSGRIVIDPGSFSDVDAALAGATAVLVTHEHTDHVRPDRLVAALMADQALTVHAPQGVLDVLVAAGAPTRALHAVVPGEVLALGGVDVHVGGGVHAQIHTDVPRPVNVGYLVGPVWHPGDSFDRPPHAVQVLLVPVGGPWLRVADAIELVRTMAPTLAVPIHDAVLSEAGQALVDRLIAGLGNAGEYRRLEPGHALEV